MEYMDPKKHTLYANNATTSWPKPSGVAQAMVDSLAFQGSAGRGGGQGSLDAEHAVEHTRERCAQFLGVSNIENLMFVPSATHGLNMVLQGYLKPGDAAIVARAEHNSVLRPLHALQKRGVELAWVPMAPGGYIDLAELEELLKIGIDQGRPFKTVICRHGSNASGALQPIEDVVLLADQYGATAISDGAQVAGHVPVSLERLKVDAWVCSGHKGLLGPKGVGLMYLAPRFDLDITVWGGTGYGDADYLCEDHLRPTCYESGTEPLPAICGLDAGVKWLQEHPQAAEYTQELGTELRARLIEIPTIRVLGPRADTPHLPLVPFVCEHIPTAVFGARLEKEYGIICRTGMHCAPDAAKVLGVYPEGSVRLSLGPFNTAQDVDYLVEAVSALAASA